MDQPRCARAACQALLGPECYRIHNNPTGFPDYRQYCLGCGNKIITFNQQSESLKLEFRICKPDAPNETPA